MKRAYKGHSSAIPFSPHAPPPAHTSSQMSTEEAHLEDEIQLNSRCIDSKRVCIHACHRTSLCSLSCDRWMPMPSPFAPSFSAARASSLYKGTRSSHRRKGAFDPFFQCPQQTINESSSCVAYSRTCATKSSSAPISLHGSPECLSCVWHEQSTSNKDTGSCTRDLFFLICLYLSPVEHLPNIHHSALGSIYIVEA